MHRFAIVTLLASVIALPSISTGVDLNGRWNFEAGGFPPNTIVTITQTGTALTIPYYLTMTGTVGATDVNGFTPFSVNYNDGVYFAGMGGRVTPSENMLHGGAASAPPYPPTVSTIVATRCTCFDNNSVDGDGCSAACQVEECWTCTGDPSVCTPTLDGGACDDLNPCTVGETCTASVCGGGTPVAPCFYIDGPWTRHRTVAALGVASHTYATISQRNSDIRIGAWGGAINPSTGALNVQAVNSNPFCASDSLSGSVAPDGLTYSMSGYLWEPRPGAEDHCDPFAQTELGDHCGNGMFEGTEACDDGNLVDGDGCSVQCAVEQCWTCSGTPSVCSPVGGGSCDDGNDCTISDTCAGDGSCAGTPDTGAACDDGSACTSGDVCAGDGSCTGTPVVCAECYACDVSLGCVVQPGAPCDDGEACTTGDFCIGDGSCAGAPLTCEPCFACDGTLGCVLQPQPSCKASTTPDKSILLVKDNADDAKDRFTWRWNKGADTLLSELGNPPGGDLVTLCVYDESTPTTALLFRERITAPILWSPTATGFHFRNPYGVGAEGTSTAQLRSGAGGKAKAKVKGKGGDLSNRPYPLPAPSLPLPLRVQLQTQGGLCLETRHDASSVLKNDAARGVFKARGIP